VVVSLRRWVIIWQGPPPPNMNGTQAHSRWKTRKDRQLWRATAVSLAVAAGIPTREIARVKLSGTFYRRALKVADKDGDIARLKSVVDGLVGGKYLPDDNRRFLDWGEVDEQHGPQGFRLVIQELPADDDTRERAAKKYAQGDDDDPLTLARRAARRARRPQRTQGEVSFLRGLDPDLREGQDALLPARIVAPRRPRALPAVRETVDGGRGDRDSLQ
jgi:hypothetical protein